MITKEFIEGEEVFAVDDLLYEGCNKCMSETIFCGRNHCTSARRDDGRDVYFQPTHDLRTLAAYHAQKHSDMQ